MGKCSEGSTLCGVRRYSCGVMVSVMRTLSAAIVWAVMFFFPPPVTKGRVRDRLHSAECAPVQLCDIVRVSRYTGIAGGELLSFVVLSLVCTPSAFITSK